MRVGPAERTAMEQTGEAVAKVSVTDDSLSVLVMCTVTEENLESLVDFLLSELAALKVVKPLDRPALLSWIGKQVDEHGPVLENAVLLEGVAPVPPTDGGIEWAGSFFDEGYVVDETTGAIDYRRRAAQRAVHKGQLLAKIKLPVPGVDGQDIFGRKLRAPQPKAALIRTGENVTKDGPEGSIYAAAEGRLRFVDDTLAVDKVYFIDGSVGLETGNVEHPGAVEIAQDVLEESKVAAKGDVEVRQVVEHADIETGGSLTVRGGVRGGPAYKIEAAGSVHARFLLDARVEAGQDVVIEREIVHSDVKTRGAVVMPKGRLIGGETVALRGGMIGQISSVAAVPTTFFAGKDFKLPEALKPSEEALEKLVAELAKQEEKIKNIHGRVATLSLQTLTKLEEMQKEAEKLKSQIDALNSDIHEIRASSEALARYAVEVRTMIYPETIFCMGDDTLRVQKEIPGPVRVCLLDGRIQVIPLEKR